jgi:hypothetical protein
MLKSIVSDINTKFAYDSHTYREKSDADGAIIDFRNWGQWELPQGCCGEEDYDWWVLSQESHKELSQFVESLRSAYSGFEIEYNTEEKNWISLYVKEIK